MNYSWQRQLILETVKESCAHLTAAQVYERAVKQCPRLSLGTVYRNLNQLSELGMLRRVGVPGEADRFDAELPVHQHLYCRRCKQVFNLNVPGAPIEEMIARCEGIRAETYNLIVTGLCPACRAAEAGQAGPHQE